VFCCCQGREEGKWGKRGVHKGKPRTGAARPEAVHDRREPEQLPHGKDVRVELSRKRSTAENAYAKPFSPSQVVLLGETW
jgi:hypothetical protein